MIRSVRLINWRSHADSFLEFGHGINGLIGIMGSGKTSTLNGVCFGLFGTFPELQQKKIKLEDVIKAKPKKESRAEVEVVFDANGKTYTVKRVIDIEKKNSAELRDDKTLVEANSQRVTEEIERLLKTNYDIFSRAIYSEQNQLDYFLTIPKGKRMGTIDSLLGLDRFAAARAGAVTLANRMSSTAAVKTAMADGLGDYADPAKSKRMSDEITALTSETARLKESVANLEREMPLIESRIRDIEKKSEKINLMRKDTAATEAGMEKTREHIEKLESMIGNRNAAGLDSEFTKLSADVKALDSTLRNNRNDINAVRSAISAAIAKAETLSKDRVPRIGAELGDAEKAAGELRSIEAAFSDIDTVWNAEKENFEKEMLLVNSLKTRLESLQDVVDKLGSLQDKCPVCSHDISPDKKAQLLSERAVEIRVLESSIREHEAMRNGVQHRLKDIENAWKKSQPLKDKAMKAEKLKSQLEEAKKELDVLTDSSNKEKERMAAMESSIAMLERETDGKKNALRDVGGLVQWAREVERLKPALEEMERKKSGMVLEISSLESGLKDVDMAKLRAEFQEKNGLKREHQAKLASMTTVCSEKKALLEEFERKKAVLDECNEQIKRIKNMAAEVERFSRALEATQQLLRTQFVEDVNLIMSQVWERLYPYNDFESIRLGVEDNDYVLQLMERNGKWRTVEGVTSGGERSIACLALRIAFARALAPHLRWLVLDEPTHNLDAKAIADLAETLRTGITDMIEQVFLITHDEKLEDAVTGRLYRLERDKANEGATKVVAMS